MTNVQVQFNEKDITAGLERLSKKVANEVIFSGAAAMALVIYDEAKLNASRHIKSGTLYNAIYRVYAKDKSDDYRVTYQISWNKRTAPHGHLIEFGTSRAPAYPFIRPAFDRVGDAIKAGQARMADRLAEVGVGE